MDPFTHGILGATTASLRIKDKKLFGIVAICGTIAGMSPDLDVVIRSSADPLMGLAYHRFFTHALLFAPFGALIVSAILWRLFFKNKIGFAPTYLACLFGMTMHGVLDAMTNYGTHLFWPITNRRESWNIISIIDPIFTFTLLVLLIATLIRKSRRYVVAGALFALLYWSAGYYQKTEAVAAMQTLAKSRGHVVERFDASPSFANIIVWRTQYQYQGTMYVDAFHLSPWHGVVAYPGDNVVLYQQPAGISPLQKHDLEFFTFFTDGWLAPSPTDNTMIADMRFAGLPNKIAPMWGIRLQPNMPEQHVAFVRQGNRNIADAKILWAMILGEPLPK